MEQKYIYTPLDAGRKESLCLVNRSCNTRVVKSKPRMKFYIISLLLKTAWWWWWWWWWRYPNIARGHHHHPRRRRHTTAPLKAESTLLDCSRRGPWPQPMIICNTKTHDHDPWVQSTGVETYDTRPSTRPCSSSGGGGGNVVQKRITQQQHILKKERGKQSREGSRAIIHICRSWNRHLFFGSSQL